jgi:hypothetical protein
MDQDWHHQMWDRQPGRPVHLEHTSTEMTWTVPLSGPWVLVIHGKKDYLGCAVRKTEVPEHQTVS